MGNSRIELLIEEIEDYIDKCKFQPLSNTKIIVNKDHIDGLISELKQITPKELEKYQKVVSSHEQILKDARAKADQLINEAAAQTSEMVNQNSIMKQAYAQADEVVKSAYYQANEILTNATTQANEMRSAAVDYMDNMLANYEAVVTQTLGLTQSHYESFYSQLLQYREVVVSNRAELYPPSIETPEQPNEEVFDTGSLAPNGDNTAMGSTGNIPTQATGPIGNTGNIPKPVTGSDTGDIKLDFI